MPPRIAIRSLKTNSGFLEDSPVCFSDQLTCIIGGRGTCKSTLIESLRFVFVSNPPRVVKSASGDGIIAKTLGAGSVRCEFDLVDDEAGTHELYVIERGTAREPRTSYADTMTAAGDHFNGDVEVYSQGMLQEIAKESGAQLRLQLIDRSNRDKIQIHSREIDQLTGKLKILGDQSRTLRTAPTSRRPARYAHRTQIWCGFGRQERPPTPSPWQLGVDAQRSVHFGVPELPDIAAYISALEDRIVGRPLQGVRLANPFLLRTAEPPVSNAQGRVVRELRRIGKRIAIGLDGDLWLVFHLMIAGRLHWRAAGAKLAGRNALAAIDFPNGSLVLTEAGTKRRASLHVLRGEEALRSVDPGGIDVFSSDLDAFRAALMAENRTLKRALTDPRVISGIGNAYSDEILHAAGLSPILLTQNLTLPEWKRLFSATRTTLQLWIDRFRSEARAKFPEHVTAFHDEMAAHGKYGKPCPTCGETIRRIRYADNETNYCPRCQTGGKILADRGLSRLLGADWPRTLDELDGR